MNAVSAPLTSRIKEKTSHAKAQRRKVKTFGQPEVRTLRLCVRKLLPLSKNRSDQLIAFVVMFAVRAMRVRSMRHFTQIKL